MVAHFFRIRAGAHLKLHDEDILNNSNKVFLVSVMISSRLGAGKAITRKTLWTITRV